MGYQLHNTLRERRTPISRRDLMTCLDNCSESTVYRLIRIMRDFPGAPVEYDDEAGGYFTRYFHQGLRQRSGNCAGIQFPKPAKTEIHHVRLCNGICIPSTGPPSSALGQYGRRTPR